MDSIVGRLIAVERHIARISETNHHFAQLGLFWIATFQGEGIDARWLQRRAWLPVALWQPETHGSASSPALRLR